MTRLVLAALVAQLAACDKSSEMLPINPGGGGGTGSGFMPDAAITEDDASSTINGRVCFLRENLQTLTQCAASGAGEFTVRLGSATVQTADDGSFTLMRPASTTGLTWLVSRGDAITSAIKFGSTTTLPALDVLAYEEMLTAMGPTVVQGSGAMMVRVTRMGAVVTGAVVSTQPAPEGDTVFYDGQNELAWETDATGTYGVAWIPSLPVGSSQVSIVAPNQAAVAIGSNPVFAQTITFVFAEIP